MIPLFFPRMAGGPAAWGEALKIIMIMMMIMIMMIILRASPRAAGPLAIRGKKRGIIALVVLVMGVVVIITFVVVVVAVAAVALRKEQT